MHLPLGGLEMSGTQQNIIQQKKNQKKELISNDCGHVFQCLWLMLFSLITPFKPALNDITVVYCGHPITTHHHNVNVVTQSHISAFDGLFSNMASQLVSNAKLLTTDLRCLFLFILSVCAAMMLLHYASGLT